MSKISDYLGTDRTAKEVENDYVKENNELRHRVMRLEYALLGVQQAVKTLLEIAESPILDEWKNPSA